jgi:hypothetical protein
VLPSLSHIINSGCNGGHYLEAKLYNANIRSFDIASLDEENT